MKKINDPLWFKDAIIYQAHVQAYSDSNEDGIGDFRGLTNKLDYIQSLGVTAIWLLPFYPSPLKDGGYDISSYETINNIYGNLGDFKRFLKAAHKRNLKVITELVLNHTSDQHPWFKRAKRAKPGTSNRDFYVWSDDVNKYKEARIIFKDFEYSNWTYDHDTQKYYWHRFYSHQPDLNFENPDVHKALFGVIDYWFNMGVDGLRLDAIPYLYEEEGSNCENLPQTHQFLKKLRTHVDNNHKDKMLLAEANQWTEDAVAYFGDNDECHMSFHFPLMPRLFMGIKMEDRFPIIDIIEQTPQIPEGCQWAMFLRNHDELTLEMVTDEERDYMYKSYARDPKQRINLGIRRRLATLLENDRRKIELMNMLLFSMPGSPVIYYGDELGMGDNFYLGDRDGVRTPMQWSSDKNAGFSKANPQKLYLPVVFDPEYHYEAVNVENHERNSSSLLWWMRHAIGIRKRYKAFSQGTIKFVNSENSNVLSFVREFEEEIILIVINLSHYPQLVSLDMEDFRGMIPIELFSQEAFPEIEEDNYNLTLGSYGYFWFNIKKQQVDVSGASDEGFPLVKTTEQKWKNFSGELREVLEKEIIEDYVKKCRWYRGKAQKIRGVEIIDSIPFGNQDFFSHLLIIEFSYTNNPSMRYFLPLSMATGDTEYSVRNDYTRSILADVELKESNGIIFESIYDEEFLQHLFTLFYQKKKIKSKSGAELTFHTTSKIKSMLKKSDFPVNIHLLGAEQSNTSVLFNDNCLLKFYRGVEEDKNPEVEILNHLSGNGTFTQLPPYLGEMELQMKNSAPISLGVLSGFVQHENDSWSYYLARLDNYLSNILANKNDIKTVPVIEESILDMSSKSIPKEFVELFGAFPLEMTELLGKRTAEMHLALAKPTEDPAFEAEPFSLLYQKSLYQSVRGMIRKVIPLLKKQKKNIPEDLIPVADEIIANENSILSGLEKIKHKKVTSSKIRIHGDYHLGQVLFTGKDFVIIDYEGEPARTLSERKLKYCPLRDVAGMIRSFHYAVFSVFNKYIDIRPEDKDFLEPWIEIWYKSISWLFLKSYLETTEGTEIVPREKEELKILLQTYLLDKAFYELGYELNNRPDWVIIPMKGINYLSKSFL